MTAAELRAYWGVPSKPVDCPAKTLPREQPERELTVAVADALRTLEACGKLVGPWSHVANERRDKGEAILAYRMGVSSGVPDFIFALADGRTGWIELKSETGQLSRAQREWRRRLLALGHKWALCRSLDEVIRSLEEWGALSTRPGSPAARANDGSREGE